MRQRNGLMVAVEGIDGMGKTTQICELEAYFKSQGIPVRRTKEPTDSEFGREIRRIAQQGREGVTLEDELNLFLKDRALDVRENIQPALEAGEVVLVDRYFYSNIAYQGALGLDPAVIRKANEGFPVPDLVILMDAPPAVGIGRIRGGRGEVNNQGYEQEDFLEKVRSKFLEMQDVNLVRIDANQDLATVTRDVRELVMSRLADKSSESS